MASKSTSSIFSIGINIGGKMLPSVAGSLRRTQGLLGRFRATVFKTFNRMAQKGQQAFSRIASNRLWQGAAVAASGIAFGLFRGVQTAADFESAMSRVYSLYKDINVEQKEMLSAQAKDLGRKTSFQASEAAQAQAVLAQSGRSVDETLAMTPAVLNLAAAAEIEMAEAADIVANTIGQFGLDASNSEEVRRAVDMLAASATAGNHDLVKLAEAMKKVGTLARLSGSNLESTGAALAVLADSGLKEAEAGTALRNIYLRLSDAKPQELLSNYGIKTMDENGDYRNLSDVLRELDSSMEREGLGELERTGLMNQIFGARSVAAASILMEKTIGGEFDVALAKVLDSEDEAKRQADIKLNNLYGAFSRLGSAWEGFNIQLFQSHLNPLKVFVDGLANTLNFVTDLNKSMPWLAQSIVVISIAFAGLVIALPILAALVASISVLKGALISLALGAKIGLLAGKMMALSTTTIPALIVKLGALAVAGWSAMAPFLPLIGTIAAVGGVIYLVIRFWPQLTAAAAKAWSAINRLWGGFARWFLGVLVNSALGGLFRFWPQLTAAAAKAWSAITRLWGGFARWFLGVLVNSTLGGLFRFWPQLTAAAAKAWSAITRLWGGFARWFLGLVVDSALGRLFRLIWELIPDAGKQFIRAILSGLRSKVGELFGWVRETWDRITGIFSAHRDRSDATRRSSERNQRRGTGVRRRSTVIDASTSLGSPRRYGGPVVRGLTYPVGEAGPELFTAPVSGQIISHETVRRLIQQPASAAHRNAAGRNPVVVNNGDQHYSDVVVHTAGLTIADIVEAVEMALEERQEEQRMALQRALHG
ncbi:MAG: phage tail tape measure protein [Aphanocapsa feldmannii 277cI]|uniref:Phage tail tape measure protein n=1 Tax=Aphanocapsa feldmannii 277cI TaxID=2507554 RepID=A0A524RVZ6_9CHRO|nr:MAG: phage tail tape measure protein [Aphanocapsa feldmannii 277cI]